MRVEVTQANIDRTLAILQDGGRSGKECVALWLGRVADGRIRIKEVFRPIHEAESDMFWITEEGMDELKRRLRESRTMVAAQVHTHPDRAFHSHADDRWAIVRHEGALSLVLPKFALTTSTLTFSAEAAVYRLNAMDEWREVPANALREHLCLV